MFRFLCHGVLMLSFACWRSHGNSDDRDASVTVDLGHDAHVWHDAGIDAFDAGLDAFDAHVPDECVPVRLAMACYPDEGRVIWAHGEATVPIRVGPTCLCDHAIECDAHILDTGRLALDVTVCEPTGDVLCEACAPEGHLYTASCRLPALTAGTWDVVVEGRNAMQLEVYPLVGPPMPIGESCITPAHSDECADWPATTMGATRVCHPRRIAPGWHTPIDVQTFTCDCNHRSSWCEVTVEGTELIVKPNLTTDVCSGPCFEPVCTTVEQRCWLPPLDEGVYQLRSPGSLLTGSVIVGGSDEEVVCHHADM